MTGERSEVRFSAEVLLYYSPRFDEAGTTLSEAGTAAQRRLEALGSFWGSSWPDESFAKSYQPAQHALLVMTQQCGADLQRIAGHIEQMAHNYGVTEANLTADIGRIADGASRESQILRDTGGLPPPPDVPESSPASPPRTAPNPARIRYRLPRVRHRPDTGRRRPRHQRRRRLRVRLRRRHRTRGGVPGRTISSGHSLRASRR